MTWRGHFTAKDYEDDPEFVADRILGSLSRIEKAEALRSLLLDWVTGQQRDEARRVERRSTYYTSERKRSRDWKAERDRLFRDDPEEWEMRYTFKGVMRAFEEVRAEIRLEVTDELLRSSFALGDGRTVTWGDAAIEDHQTRIRMLGDNVLGNLTTMELHEQAIAMIRSSGAANLSQIALAE